MSDKDSKDIIESAPFEDLTDAQKKYPHLDPEKAKKAELTAIKLGAKKALREFSKDSEWDLSQQVMQEVIAHHVIPDPNKRIPATVELIEDYKRLVNERYSKEHEPELYDLLMQCAPSVVTIRNWMKMKGWEEAVWTFVRGTELFTKERRSSMIDALYRRGLERDTQAAKIWLTLSGDYAEKMDIKSDDTVDKFREINELLHRKK